VRSGENFGEKKIEKGSENTIGNISGHINKRKVYGVLHTTTKGGEKMLVVGIYKDNAKNFSGLTVAKDWKNFTRRIGFYYSNIFQVKERILNGEIIDLPYITLRLDRRIKREKVKIERRVNNGFK